MAVIGRAEGKPGKKKPITSKFAPENAPQEAVPAVPAAEARHEEPAKEKPRQKRTAAPKAKASVLKDLIKAKTKKETGRNFTFYIHPENYAFIKKLQEEVDKENGRKKGEPGSEKKRSSPFVSDLLNGMLDELREEYESGGKNAASSADDGAEEDI